MEAILDASVAAKPAHLFEPRTAFQWGESPINGGSNGNLLFQSQSPQYGADIWYHLASPASGQVTIAITNGRGDTVSRLNGPTAAGLHRVSWNFQVAATPPALTVAQRQDSLAQAMRVAAVLDSIERAGTIPKATVDAVRNLAARGPQGLLPGGGGGGGGGGRGGFAPGGGPPVFNERPGESAALPSSPPRISM